MTHVNALYLPILISFSVFTLKFTDICVYIYIVSIWKIIWISRAQ